MSEFIKTNWKGVITLFVFLVIVYDVIDGFINDDEPKAAQIQQELEHEFEAINPITQSGYYDYLAAHKSRNASVSGAFSTNLTFPEVRNYYDQELARNGWKFDKEERVQDWWRDFGGGSVQYCKGNYRAFLQYAGENADYGWNFSLSLSWRLENEKLTANDCK